MYAIIEDSGTQIKVSEGDVIRVDVRDLPDDAATLTFDRVLMVGGEGEAVRALALQRARAPHHAVDVGLRADPRRHLSHEVVERRRREPGAHRLDELELGGDLAPQHPLAAELPFARLCDRFWP